MKIERRKLSEIIPAGYNPRKRDEAAIEKIVASLQTFGNVEPIVVNARTGHIVGGHLRYIALQRAGETEADCVLVDFDDDNEKKLNIALNKIKGDWDTKKLAELLQEFEHSANLVMTGFAPQEVALLVAELNADVDNVFADSDFDEGTFQEMLDDKDSDEDTDEDADGYSDSHGSYDGERGNAEGAPAQIRQAGSYVVVAKFDNREEANDWLASIPFEQRVKETSKTLVIRIAED